MEALAEESGNLPHEATWLLYATADENKIGELQYRFSSNGPSGAGPMRVHSTGRRTPTLPIRRDSTIH